MVLEDFSPPPSDENGFNMDAAGTQCKTLTSCVCASVCVCV